MKAMLLAAGRGERLRPLTDEVPKPLLTAAGKPLIDYHLYSLRRLGIQEVVINVSYRAEQLFDYVGDGSRYGLKVLFSWEKEARLETGGGVYHALPLLGEAPFIVVSADVWTQYTFPASFMSAASDAHLVLVDNPLYHPEGDYALTEAGRVTQQGTKLNYAGIAKLHPRLFSGCEPRVFPLSLVINQAIARGAVTGEYYAGPWFNVGTAAELEQLERFIKNS